VLQRYRLSPVIAEMFSFGSTELMIDLAIR